MYSQKTKKFDESIIKIYFRHTLIVDGLFMSFSRENTIGQEILTTK